MKSFIALLVFVFLVSSVHAEVYHEYYGQYGGDDYVTYDDYLEDYFENDKAHATPPFAPRQTFGGCYISTGSGLLDDLDCDKVPDPIDNCRGVINPDQLDQNENGIGDACDLIITQLEFDPQEVLQGRSFIVTAHLTNYQPYELRNLKLRAQIPELGLEEITYVDIIEGGDEERYEFYFRIPECANEGKYNVVLFIEYPVTPGQNEVFSIAGDMRVQGGACKQERQANSNSIITILDIQDVDPELGGVYPFTIVNREAESQAYVLTIDGMDWGDFVFEPRSLILVPAGESARGELWVYADKDVTGEHSFSLTVQSKNDAQLVLMTARIPENHELKQQESFMQFGIFAVGIIILILAFGLIVQKTKKTKKKQK